jgi:pimeloyl-ACP methyl ester carboxylesterase
MSVSRSLQASLAVVGVVAAACLPATTAGAHTGPTVDWRTCGKQPGAQCATLTLPVDWSDPRGPTFGLAIARRPATDPAARVGTLIFGPGGPGDSGVQRVADSPGRFSDELRRRFDIVSFDPRGVGGSGKIACSTDRPVPPTVLTSQADFDATVAYNRSLWANCRNQPGTVFDHADTASTVRDLEALREALGERKLTFHGSSYGTLLGEQYAERYPDRVRAIVLESVDDHRPASTGDFLAAQAWALEDSFDAFVDWCDADPTCKLHGTDVRKVWAGVLAAADAGKLNMSRFDLVANVHLRVKAPDYPALADYLAQRRDGIPDKPVGNLGVVVPAFCSDWSLPIRNYAQYAAILRQTAATAPDTRYPAQVFALTMCLGWPQPVANPQHYLHVRTSVPLLLLNSRHDPATGLNWARSVERQLGRHGVLVVYQGAGHGSYTLSDCMQQVADHYLIDLVVPPRGTTC